LCVIDGERKAVLFILLVPIYLMRQCAAVGIKVFSKHSL
jgi:hypothetical protein